jgi:hypothetical protein
VLRAGPFSDERVVRLINRRFVPLAFDLQPIAPLADRDARVFVGKARKDLLSGSVHTPPVMIVTPGGKVLAEIDNYSTEEQMLAALRDVLSKHPEWNRVSEEEQRVTSGGSRIEQAIFLFDTGREAGACQVLAKDPGEEAALLLAHFARLTKDWDAMETALVRVTNEKLRNAVLVERAWRLFARKEFAAIERSLATVPKVSDRYSEARYLLGLALFHQGRTEDAIAAWKATIAACPQDRWIYRADWAVTQLLDGDRRDFSTIDARSSPLGRIGYMGRRNPDLEK